MLYTEKEKHEIERVKEVFAEHLRQSPDFELLWSDKVGYVWLTIGVNPLYVDTGIRIESAADLCGRCLDDVATDVLYMTGNDHALEAADPLELAEIKRRWELYINQLPDYAYLCKDLLDGHHLGTIYRKSTTNTGDKRNAENPQKHRVYASFRRFLIPQPT